MKEPGSFESMNSETANEQSIIDACALMDHDPAPTREHAEELLAALQEKINAYNDTLPVNEDAMLLADKMAFFEWIIDGETYKATLYKNATDGHFLVDMKPNDILVKVLRNLGR